ncbi:MAG: TetR/AcrR family transcriptional regulator, partial [Pseudohongiellaceae bacterium]
KFKKSTAKTRFKSKRDHVLEVASECFLKQGFDGTSINVMARDAGISKESIYRYFGSKEDLFLAVVELELDAYLKGMQATASDYQNQSLEDALFHVAEAAMTVLADDRAMALRQLIFQMAARGSKIGAAYYDEGPMEAYRNLKLIFDYHRPKLQLETDLSSEKLSRYFLSMILHSTTLERECGVLKKLGKRKLENRCHEAVKDFMEVFLG